MTMTSAMSSLELKRELTKHGVALPKVPVSKEAYEQLYLDHVLSKKSKNGGRNGAGEFSSDEEMDRQDDSHLLENEVGGGDTAVKAKSQIVWSEDLVRIVDEMTNEQIYAALVELGQIVGPVVASTRGMYRRKLLDLQSRNAELNLSSMLQKSSENREGSPVANGFSSDDEIETSDTVPDDAELLPREYEEEQRKQHMEEFHSSSQTFTSSSRVEKATLFSSPAGSYASANTYGSQFSTPTGFDDQSKAQGYQDNAKYDTKTIKKESAQRSSIYGFFFWGSFVLFAAIALGYYFLTYESEEAWKDEVDAQIDDMLRSIPETGNI